ncbi:sensor histidine kinase [Kibdelosporangium phytohabitans]|uniref:histidine kinase n=1 Tax=Kibdelosporangium phytohabitans TaxID=860235 RepID=A0A0N9I632_9PSEU|nr:sensor histidine kinase [Kibdelosporangium phytohabitans]ALG10339.1 histidine kinase [Kibdelosporangium phytohabitans]MBE1461384.1 signal transduction histidine kinase [Kibdelosporangium phytohabitans]
MTTQRGAQLPRKRDVWSRVRDTVESLEHLVGGLATGVMALATLLWLVVTALLCVVGVGLYLAPTALRVVRVVADRERARLSRWGVAIVDPEPLPDSLGAALRDPAVRQELRWILCHAAAGFLLGIVGATLPLYVVTDITFLLWWQLLPPDAASDTLGLVRVHDAEDALWVTLMGMGWGLVVVAVLPLMARAQARIGRGLLSPDPGADLALRVVRLAATRAAALEAHAAELRRIERSLHDGTQNRLVAVSVLLGAARRALARDPASVGEVLERAQFAAEQALAELRDVVRSILPPVLSDRSLPSALTALVASCPVPCVIDADLPERCAASVEATAYLVVAEALTNIAKHSGARNASVQLRYSGGLLLVKVTDDGHGGAEEGSGSGLVGIRRRVEAHDGMFTLDSPIEGPTVLTVGLPCGS